MKPTRGARGGSRALASRRPLGALGFARAFAFPAALALASALLSSGCDGRFFSESPSATCTVTGAQCQLPEGPLGVCERTSCRSGETAPCFQCTSQH